MTWLSKVLSSIDALMMSLETRRSVLPHFVHKSKGTWVSALEVGTRGPCADGKDVYQPALFILYCAASLFKLQ